MIANPAGAEKGREARMQIKSFCAETSHENIGERRNVSFDFPSSCYTLGNGRRGMRARLRVPDNAEEDRKNSREGG